MNSNWLSHISYELHDISGNELQGRKYVALAFVNDISRESVVTLMCLYNKKLFGCSQITDANINLIIHVLYKIMVLKEENKVIHVKINSLFSIMCKRDF